MKDRVVWAVALLQLALLGGCGASPERGESDPAGPVVAVSARAIESRRFDDVVVANGQWKSSGDLVIAAPFAGTVESLTPRAGDAVKAGQHLGWLVTRESRAALRGAALLAEEAKSAADREEAQRALALARRDQVRVPLLAPGAGIVNHRAVEAGSELVEGAEVLTLTPRSALVCEAHVPAAFAARVRRGQHATLREEGAGVTRSAVVQRVLPVAAAGDQSTLVWLSPQGTGPAPALDRFVTATIELGPPRERPAVPDSAVTEDDLTGETRVAVVGRDSIANWVTVVLGNRAAGWRELVSPALPAGTRVIVVGQHGLPDSTRVNQAP